MHHLKVFVYIEYHINFQYPHFTAPQQQLFVEENVPVGYEVSKVFAVDEDSGLNGFIRYSIDLKLDDPGYRDFEIDENTGVIKTKNLLDRELIEKYIIKVPVIYNNITINYKNFSNKIKSLKILHLVVVFC